MSVNNQERLILWDIDHTLLDGGGVSRDAYASAFARVIRSPMAEMADMTGKTELLIAAETLELNGLTPSRDLLTTFITAVADELTARSHILAARGHVLPGAAEALEALSGIPGIHQSVLTGNMRTLAELKLKTFGLITHLNLEAGAYGDDAQERVALLPHAWQRAQEHYGREFRGAETVIVGDTLLDIATAKSGDARVIAVATGSAPLETLREAEADAVLPDLSDTQAFVKAVLASTA
ncbi:HAD family hydrolase [Streptomyces silvisoli]|uniref:Haloacid dehalogenase-like hydrolase n=1 Tax=Streptomyces silvisoli TaxID=3034235 RepID=A0ABT5ZKK6_9ACTN|nr:HAD family hydrolase [Streptomyces silvisoli]MDF3290124.1 haloacid dehalogenase-like hydrolase [Streptomyces silvisoli]